MLSEAAKRELRQLYYVACLYMNLAEKAEATDDIKQRTIKQQAKDCEKWPFKDEIKPLIEFSAHLGSAAARLWAIEEKLNSSRKATYDSIVKSKIKKGRNGGLRDDEVETIKRELKCNPNVWHLAHRILITHSEWLQNLDIIGDFTYKTIAESMRSAVNEIKKDLEKEENNVFSP